MFVGRLWWVGAADTEADLLLTPAPPHAAPCTPPHAPPWDQTGPRRSELFSSLREAPATRPINACQWRLVALMAGPEEPRLPADREGLLMLGCRGCEREFIRG